MRSFLVFVIAILALGAVAEEETLPDRARVLVYKQLMTDPVVEGQDMTLTYSVFNVGKSSAFDVVVQDKWPEEIWERVEGDPLASFPVVEPNSNVTYNVTLKPLKAGQFESERASVTYAFGPEGNLEQTSGFSTDLLPMVVLSALEYEHMTALYVREWTTFAALFLGPVVLPMIFWLVLRRRNSLHSKTN